MMEQLATCNPEFIDNLKERYMPHVYKIARWVANHSSRFQDIDDMVQDGMLGLCKAAAKNDPSNKTNFSAYATWYIKGEIYEGMRRMSYNPTRTIKANARRNKAQNRVEQQLGRKAHDGEIATEAGMDMWNYHSNVAAMDAGQNTVHYEGTVVHDKGASSSFYLNPEEIMIKKEENKEAEAERLQLRLALGTLSVKERTVILGIFRDNKSRNDIAAEIGTSELYVRQIKQRALKKCGEILKRERTVIYNPTLTEHLHKTYIDDVTAIARSMKPQMPESVEIEDMVQDGMLGLANAATKFKNNKGQFIPFAEEYVRSAISDGHNTQG